MYRRKFDTRGLVLFQEAVKEVDVASDESERSKLGALGSASAVVKVTGEDRELTVAAFTDTTHTE